ncbi:MAG: patatin-like phospholipase family protein [Anaerolineales bacterium]
MSNRRERKRFFGRARLGLALSGGGSRGLAHIGVLKVLEREGIEVAALAGTSMGGLIGAAYAAGMSPEELEAEALRMSQLRELIKLVEWFPPRGKLLDPQRIRLFLGDRLKLDVDFDELRFPFAVTAVDLKTNQMKVIRSGSVLRAVEATTALPGLFAAVDHQGGRLVDGGVLNNLPVDLLTPLGAKSFMAVDVGFQLVREHPEKEIPILRSLPEVATEFYQVGALMVAEMTQHRLESHPPHLLIRPELPPGTGILSGFVRPKEIIDSGEEAASAAIKQIRNLARPGFFDWLQGNPAKPASEIQKRLGEDESEG